MPRLLNDLKILIFTNAWLLPVLGGLIGAVFLFVAPPPPMSATLATGQAGSGYAAFGEQLKEHQKIVDFTTSNDLHARMMAIDDDDFDTRDWFELFDELAAKLKS